jgi:hypothetical protein
MLNFNHAGMRKYMKLKKKYLLIMLILYECYNSAASIAEGASAAIASPSNPQINSLQTLTIGLQTTQQSQDEQVNISDILTTRYIASQTRQKQETPAIYKAIAEDIVQIFKWMESPDMTPAKLANNILLRQFNPNDIVASTQLVGLPSINYSKDDTVKQYQSGGVFFLISGYPEDKKIFSVVIRPSTYNLKKRWFNKFSTIKLMKYLSEGTEKSQMRDGGMAGYPSITQIINLKQKYFKSSKFKNYSVTALSYPDGSWNEPKGREFFKENYPDITLEIDPRGY